MTIEVALIISVISIFISVISVGFAIYQGTTTMDRDRQKDDRTDTTALTTVIVKLEGISNGITEIKNEIISVKTDIQDNRSRIIILEESTKSLHKRMDSCERHCKHIFKGVDKDE